MAEPKGTPGHADLALAAGEQRLAGDLSRQDLQTLLQIGVNASGLVRGRDRRRYPKGLAGSIVQFSAPLSEAERERCIMQGRQLAYTERKAAGVGTAADQSRYVTWKKSPMGYPSGHRA